MKSHDGMRIMARRDGAGVRLITRNGNDFTSRFPFMVAAVTALPARSFLIDGEAIVTDSDGLAVFDLIRHKRHGEGAVLCAFDLIELDGEDLRRSSIEYRKRKLAKLVTRSAHLGIVLNEHYEGTARSFLSTPASSAAKLLFRSGLAHSIGPGARRIG
jgi:bifunctional non-homologous end joining protein LigD